MPPPERDDGRPLPEALLAKAQREEESARKGRFKVFFGASPGVGKTYAMLESARRLKQEGRDVVVGIVETHGRSETAAMLEGLEVLPRRLLEYRGRPFPEFDLDAALARKPSLLLLDELAHTNVPGSRHPKRWQDVMELLDAGIDVHSTLNVQHLESLNDVIEGITGVQVRETVPDTVIERANEISLVDLPPEILLQRLREGKVYLPDQARAAVDRFFARGNLLALRELALRSTAERVDADVQAYRIEQGIQQPWYAGERVMACIGPGPGGKRIVRAARRMAAGLRAPWIAAHVSTGRDELLPDADRASVQEALRLAESLGGEAVTLSGFDEAPALLAYARERNVTRIVLGKPSRRRMRDFLGGSLADRLLRGSGDVDVLVTTGDPGDAERAPLRAIPEAPPWTAWAGSIGVVGAATAAGLLLFGHVDLSEIAMVYLLGIVVVAIRWGRMPSILASLLSTAAFDWCFVPPRFTFAVSDARFLLTFVVMFVVGLVVSTLTGRVRTSAFGAAIRERRMSALYALGRELSRARKKSEIAEAVARHVEEAIDGKVVVLLADTSGDLVPMTGMGTLAAFDSHERSVAQWSFENLKPAGFTTDTLPGGLGTYLPIRVGPVTHGVLGVLAADERLLRDPERWRLLEASCDLAGLALERVRLAKEAQDAQVRVHAEETRSALLSSVSHDLRTPLATITGSASALQGDLDSASRKELARNIVEEGERLNRLVTNLLDMTRLQAGGQPRREWASVVEIVDSALRRLERVLAGRPVTLEIAPGLPMVEVDEVLLENALANLLENAVKHTPPGTPVTVSARVEDSRVVIEVADRGPGISPGSEERIFEKFYRAPGSEGRGGVGLGLTIVRAILEAHGGRVAARNRDGGGSVFRLELPRGRETPPVPPEKPERDGVAG